MSALPREEDILVNSQDEDQTELDLGPEEVGEEAVDIEVTVEDDTPEEDRGRKPLGEDPEPTDDEVEEYSAKVKQRISKMRHGIHDERRAKEAAIRERDEAVALTKRIIEEKKGLEERNRAGESAYIAQAKDRVDMALREAKREFVEAHEEGNSEKLADLHERIAALAAEKQRVDGWAQAQQSRDSALQTPQPVVQSQPTQRPQPIVVDEDAQKWAKKNTWFNKDKVMTAVAYAVHDELVASGVDPKIEPAEYYSTINKRMRERFPEYEWGDGPRKARTHANVASVGRTTNTAKRVVLTQSQAAIAKRVGLTLEQYASEVAKLKQNSEA